ncbi:hypothetical protein [Chryseobacterium sp.]|uniref:hypothetical protein n=1 Tax=Chryseobacterium sp. TaxID=1871047 RepID=UPI0025B990B4|nr:hypothetical protein [Chryseobacterium sp.]
MNPTPPPKFKKALPFLKRMLITTVIISGVTFAQMYWSMGIFSNRISSGCPDCSFFEDAVFLSLLTGLFLSAGFRVLHCIKKMYIKAMVEFLILVILWFFWNYSIFVDRESSWSTYDFSSEIYYTFSQSVFPAIILGGVCIFLLHYKEIKKSH